MALARRYPTYFNGATGVAMADLQPCQGLQMGVVGRLLPKRRSPGPGASQSSLTSHEEVPA